MSFINPFVPDYKQKSSNSSHREALLHPLAIRNHQGVLREFSITNHNNLTTNLLLIVPVFSMIVGFARLIKLFSQSLSTDVNNHSEACLTAQANIEKISTTELIQKLSQEEQNSLQKNTYTLILRRRFAYFVTGLISAIGLGCIQGIIGFTVTVARKVISLGSLYILGYSDQYHPKASLKNSLLRICPLTSVFFGIGSIKAIYQQSFKDCCVMQAELLLLEARNNLKNQFLKKKLLQLSPIQEDKGDICSSTDIIKTNSPLNVLDDLSEKDELIKTLITKGFDLSYEFRESRKLKGKNVETIKSLSREAYLQFKLQELQLKNPENISLITEAYNADLHLEIDLYQDIAKKQVKLSRCKQITSSVLAVCGLGFIQGVISLFAWLYKYCSFLGYVASNEYHKSINNYATKSLWIQLCPVTSIFFGIGRIKGVFSKTFDAYHSVSVQKLEHMLNNIDEHQQKLVKLTPRNMGLFRTINKVLSSGIQGEETDTSDSKFILRCKVNKVIERIKHIFLGILNILCIGGIINLHIPLFKKRDLLKNNIFALIYPITSIFIGISYIQQAFEHNENCTIFTRCKLFTTGIIASCGLGLVIVILKVLAIPLSCISYLKSSCTSASGEEGGLFRRKIDFTTEEGFAFIQSLSLKKPDPNTDKSQLLFAKVQRTANAPKAISMFKNVISYSCGHFLSYIDRYDP